ncbi:hypothetical protein AMATHDRAFT_64019 [Amanita thiersii Skay4041]|uniref:Uncharacterized protein n=1 Tax=Amanita thiersii Skay4041 TaxID=703135 RepID=A0A2A9NDC9_9AGAR|nr:hypothetical protein AMATHDRAFT_64019 [Amanita thiersii Skay4041]
MCNPRRGVDNILPDLTEIGQSNREYSNIAMHIARHLASCLEDEIRQVVEVVRQLQLQARASLEAKHQLLSAEDKLECLKKQLHECKSVFAPHKKLPADVLQYIFLLCAKGAKIKIPLRSRYWHPIPMVLSHTCASWRSVALATPSLWTNLEVSHFTCHAPRLLAVKDVLSRVKFAPLSLSVFQNFPEYTGYILDNDLAAFVDTLQRQLLAPYRIQKLSLTFGLGYSDPNSATFTMGKVQKILSMSLPDLQILQFAMCDWPFTWGVSELAEFLNRHESINEGSALGGLPSLKELDLDCHAHFYKGVHRYIRWEQLRTLSFQQISISWALAILSQCRCLEAFAVFQLTAYTQEEFAPAPLVQDILISLPHMHRLRLSISHLNNEAIRRFLSPLAFPNLKYLLYSAPHEPDKTTWPYQYDPLIYERLQLNTLQELRVSGNFCLPLTTWKEACALRRLRVCIPQLNDEDASDIASGILFPLLEDVYMERPRPSVEDPAPFFRMIEGRQKRAREAIYGEGVEGSKPVSPFKRVGFRCTEEYLETYKNQIDILRNGGCELDIDMVLV